jgi:hypothetical protein
VPEHDPVPYLPSDVPPGWRRPNPPPDVVPSVPAPGHH